MEMAQLQPLGNTNISDDDELANVLAGVKNEAASIDATRADLAGATLASLPPVPPTPPTMDFEQTQPAIAPATISDITPVQPFVSSAPSPIPSITTPVAASPELEALKKATLGELRPLVGKLDLPAEEKFDTLLLIIRSTDDQSLLGPAHDAAKSIADETRRATALLDIIKEIDYFSTKA